MRICQDTQVSVGYECTGWVWAIGAAVLENNEATAKLTTANDGTFT